MFRRKYWLFIRASAVIQHLTVLGNHRYMIQRETDQYYSHVLHHQILCLFHHTDHRSLPRLTRIVRPSHCDKRTRTQRACLYSARLGPPAYSFSVSDFWDSDLAHAQSLTESGLATVWYAKFDNLKKHRPDVSPCDVSPSVNLWLTRRSESCLSSRIHRTFPASTMFDQLWLNEFGPLNFLPPWPT
jgi:hypothetical protein